MFDVVNLLAYLTAGTSEKKMKPKQNNKNNSKNNNNKRHKQQQQQQQHDQQQQQQQADVSDEMKSSRTDDVVAEKTADTLTSSDVEYSTATTQNTERNIPANDSANQTSIQSPGGDTDQVIHRSVKISIVV